MHTSTILLICVVAALCLGGCPIRPWGERVAQGTLLMWIDSANDELAEELQLSASQVRQLAGAMYDVAVPVPASPIPEIPPPIADAATLDAATRDRIHAAWLRYRPPPADTTPPQLNPGPP